MADLKNIVERYMENIACCDFQKIEQLYHGQYFYIGSDGKNHKGPDARFDVAGLSLREFPDLSYEIVNMYQSGNTVITEFIIRGTHMGDLMGIPPTNRKIEVPACNIIEIREGRIYSEREYFDKVYLMQQLGIEDVSVVLKSPQVLA
jgi:steroid delta-isomerase-like uncharacterized protein